ncbi:MAG: hypothetical protein Q7I98_08455 [Erysipelotrichaceae bacterium]|nr:hypothetical protein [Erysipelotrichaceae bacterium]
MNNKILSVLLLLSLLLNGYSVLKIGRLADDLNQQQMLVNDIQNNVNGQIYAINSGVDKKLKEQASLLESQNVSFGKMDAKTLKVPVEVSVLPKRYVDGMRVRLLINNQELEMQKGTEFTFTGSLDVSVFEELAVMVALENGGVREVEKMPMVSPLIYNYLPNISANFSGSTSYNSGQYELKGNVSIYLDPERYKEDLVKVGLLEIVDGKVIKEYPTELSPNIIIPMSHQVALEKYQLYQIVAVAEDRHGLIHRHVVYGVTIDTEGLFQGIVEEGQFEIRNQGGQVLYRTEGKGL